VRARRAPRGVAAVGAAFGGMDGHRGREKCRNGDPVRAP
jgi:hypothetical protein